MKSILLKIALFAVIIFLGYKVYDSVMQPLNFLKEKKQRDIEVIQRLKDIRSVQSYYKNAKGKYASSFDSLIVFLNTGEIPVVKLVPDPTDTTFTRTIADTLGYVKVSDSLFAKRANFHFAQLKYVPFTDKAVFELEAGEIDRGGVKVSVFEAKVPFNVYLAGLELQRIMNMSAKEKDLERYPGLKVGSMKEPSTDGNWE